MIVGQLAQPTIRPLFRFFGSKWTLAVKYPPPRHEIIVEPFAGGAGYSTRYHDHQIILCEKDPKIAAIWRWLIAARPDDIRDVPLLAPGEYIPESWPDPIRWFVGFWATLTGAKPQPRLVPCSADNPGSFWNAKVRERTANAVEHLRHWIIVEGDYSEIDDIGPATWYVDPPYVPPASGKKTGAMYAQTPESYPALAEWCVEREGQVIVCENDGADWLPFCPFVRGHAAPRGAAGTVGTAESMFHLIDGVMQ